MLTKMPQNTIREDRWRVKDIVMNYRPPTTENPEGEGDLCLPPSQRGWAWKNARGKKKQIMLIDSVMNNIPIPTCILNRQNHRKFHVYDGRHRFQTFYEYANDGFEWDGRKYSQLTDDEKQTFDEREIPVTIVSNISMEQLCDMFIRVNSGASLKDYDLFWANMDRPLMQSVRNIILSNTRLADCFGLSAEELNRREDLGNWVSLMCGLATRKSTNISTSYIRISDSGEINLDTEVDEAIVREGLDVVCRMYEAANTKYHAEKKEKKQLKKVAKLTAFFLHDWFAMGEPAINKWVDVIGKLRSAETKTHMSLSLSTVGAQNLTNTKVTTVMRQVNHYLETGRVLYPGTTVDDDDDSQ
jgi:hypothetical protein